jgi:hypothetical protein
LIVRKIRCNQGRLINKQRVALVDDATKSVISICSGLNTSSKSSVGRKDNRMMKKSSKVISPSRLVRVENFRDILIEDKTIRSVGV